MASLADLVVKLDVDSARFRGEIQKASSDLGKFGERIASAAELVKHAFEFEIIKEVTEKLGEFVLKGAEAADKMGKLAQSTGVPIESLSRLSYAAGLADISTETMGHSLEKMAKTMAGASDGTGSGAKAFEALGVKVTDSAGRLRGTEEVFKEVAEKMSRFEDGATKAALAQAIFGRGGADLIPLLNAGAAGLGKMGAEADALGLTISQNTAKSAEEFNDNLKRMHLAMEGVAITVASRLAPMMSQLSDEIVGTTKSSGALTFAVDGLVVAFKGIVTVGEVIVGVFKTIGMGLGGLIAAFIRFEQGQFKEAGNILKAAAADIGKEVSDRAAAIGHIWEDKAHDAEEKGPGQAKKLAAPIFNLSDETEKAGKRALATLTKVIEGYQEKIARVQYGAGDMGELKFRVNEGDLSRALAAVGPKAQELKQKLLDVATAWGKVDDAAKATKAAEDATKKLESEVSRLQETMAKKTGGELEAMLVKLRSPELVESLAALDDQMRTTFVGRLKDAAVAADRFKAAQDELAESERQELDLEREAAEVTKYAMTATDKYNERLERLNAMLDKGLLSQDAYNNGVARAEQEFESAGGKMTRFTEEMTQSMGDAFAENVFDGFDKGLGAMAEAFGKTLEKMIAQALAAQLLQGLFGLGAQGGWGTNLLNGLGGAIGGSGARASGGDVRAGQSYLVGEQGPETFVPALGGSIIPARGEASNRSSSGWEPPRRHILEVADHGNRTVREIWEGFLADEAAAR